MLNLIIFISPILLLILIGILIRARGNPETAGRRYFLFLVWITLGALALTLLNWMVPRLLFAYGMVLFPIIPGLVVLTLLHWGEWNSLSRRVKMPILFAAGILLVTILVQLVRIILKGDTYQLESLFFGTALLAVSAFLLLVWKWGTRYPLLLFVITVLYLTFFLGFDLGSLTMFTESAPGQMYLHTLSALAYLAIPGMTVSVMAMLTAGALNASSTTDETKTVAWSPILGRLFLVTILFGLLLYVYRWLWLWDEMEDGIRWIFMILVSGMAALSAGMVIAMTTIGGRRWAGLVFVLAVMGPIYLVAIASGGIWNGVTNYTITEERAAHLQTAIENHHAKTGWYPLSLAELVPDELWRIPLPMIMPGQGWCYQGGSNYYRLGAVYREHWSSPYLEVRVYASAGNIPEGTWECDEKLAEAISQSGFYDPAPTPMPLPTSVTSVQKVIIEPLVRAESFSLSGWSLDGRYLAFETNEFSPLGMQLAAVDLHFLDVKTGEVCQPDKSKRSVSNTYNWHEHTAWLPDGRLLYLTDDGTLLAFTPCSAEAEEVIIPVRFTHVMSADKASGHILMKDAEAYWLMDGSSLEVRKIEGVPTESYRPMYAWSPGGERLAMSLMNGPMIEDEAFLYIVDWASAEVMNVFPLVDASDEYLPHIGWLTPDELLVHGKTVTIMDFRAQPPATTDVLKDIFLLDIAYPIDVWGMETVSDKDGEGYFIGVQVNHPRNKGSYIYSSQTGRVEIFHYDVSGLIFLPDGQWMRLLKWEDPPTATPDEYELVWLDGSRESLRLTVEGHTPRAHFQIFPTYLPATSQLVFSSSQGISLVSLPDGKTVGFWDISSDADYFGVMASPNGEALIVESGGDGLYYIPLLPQR